MAEIKKRKMWELPGVRYIFAVNSMLGFAVIYALRVNLSVAIVAMVNNTVYDKKNDTHSNECPREMSHLIFNSTEPEPTKDGPFMWYPGTQANILAAFFYPYWITQIPGGRLAEIYSGKWVFGFGALVTILLSLITPIAANAGVAALTAVRAVEGIAQGVTLPAMNTLVGRWFPDTEKSFLYAVVHCGTSLGAMISMTLTGYLCGTTLFGGWPSAFYVMGVCGAVWFVMWCLFVTDSPQTNRFISRKELRYIELNQRIDHHSELPPIPWRKILKSLPFWVYVLTQTCQDWIFYTIMTDLPTYFSTILHFPLTENGFFSSFPHVLAMFLALAVTMGTDYLIRKGKTTTILVRKVCNSIGGFGAVLALVGVMFAGCSVLANKLFFVVAITIQGFVFSGHAVTLLDMSPEYAGTLLGVASTISNLTGFLTPLVVGALTDSEQTLGQWRIVFSITASLLGFASICFLFFATADRQDWADKEPADPPPQDLGKSIVGKQGYKTLEED